MSSYLLRFEAADFDNTVFDSQSISAVRGASLTFLFSSDRVVSTLGHELSNWRVIYTGASQGAFTFDADEAKAKEVERAVEDALHQNDIGGEKPTGCHRHMAYVVALVPFEKSNEVDALHTAESICNVKKLQGVGFPLPVFDTEVETPGEGSDPRPAAKGSTKSTAIAAREAFGRHQRQSFYSRMIGYDPGFDFTDTIEDIVKDAHQDLPLSLRSKIAVFYADGNKLNKHRKEAMKAGLDGLARFSSELKVLQRGLMEKITAWLGNDLSRQTNAAFYKGDARFETLMWGGDEVLFVMPSWQALDFASIFFKATENWKINNNPVTLSAGLVICNAKTPIRQAKTVALTMADLCKENMDGFGQNALQIEVFESITMPDTDFKSYRENFFFGAGSHVEADRKASKTEPSDHLTKQVTIGGNQLDALIDKIFKLDTGDNPFPRSQLYKLLDIASKEGASVLSHRPGGILDNDVVKALEAYLAKAGAGKDFSIGHLQVLNPIQGSKASFAINLAMIAMLWDYCKPIDKLQSKGDWA